MTSFDLSGRVAVVTGGTVGIGLGKARALAGAGARVVHAARSRERGEAAAEALRAEGGEAEFRAVEVTDPDSIAALAEGVAADLGGLDAMVTSAGRLIVKPALEYAPAEVDELLAVNVRGAFLCAQAAARVMIPRRRGKILLLSSVLAERAVPNQAAYIATKGAITALARALAVEWGPHNIQVNALGPQLTRSPMTEGLFADPEKMAGILAITPAGRAGEPEDLAGAALFLCSPASDYLSGQHIVVDGGRSAGG